MSFSSLINKASNFLGIKNSNIEEKSDGEIVFCKNNICVHSFIETEKENHNPGYLSIKTQDDETLGTTLILTWTPNHSLKRNPRSIENSPIQNSQSLYRRYPRLEYSEPSTISNPSSADGSAGCDLEKNQFLNKACNDQANEINNECDRKFVTLNMCNASSCCSQSFITTNSEEFIKCPSDYCNNCGLTSNVNECFASSSVEMSGEHLIITTTHNHHEKLDSNLYHNNSSNLNSENFKTTESIILKPDQVNINQDCLDKCIYYIHEIPSNVTSDNIQNNTEHSISIKNQEFSSLSDNKNQHCKDCKKFSTEVQDHGNEFSNQCRTHSSLSQEVKSCICHCKYYKHNHVIFNDQQDEEDRVNEIKERLDDETKKQKEYDCCDGAINSNNPEDCHQCSMDNQRKRYLRHSSTSTSGPDTDFNIDEDECDDVISTDFDNRNNYISKDDDVTLKDENITPIELTNSPLSIYNSSNNSSYDHLTLKDDHIFSKITPNKIELSEDKINFDVKNCKKLNNKFEIMNMDGQNDSKENEIARKNDGVLDRPNVLSSVDPTCSIFSVDLGEMHNVRIFHHSASSVNGQLVISSKDRLYKILYFHHGGLDRLTQVFNNCNFLAPKYKQPGVDEQCQEYSIIRPKCINGKRHPEEGCFPPFDSAAWRRHVDAFGRVQDDLQIRKTIYFGGLEASLRSEMWLFLLDCYPYNSTFEQREQLRNDRYVAYQKIRKTRDLMNVEMREKFWKDVQCTVEKDVVRTDRTHQYFKGDLNPNIEILKNILLNYAVTHPQHGYAQGMSDMLAPILVEVRNEVDAYWCFVGLMARSVFFNTHQDLNMHIQLIYLQELIRILLPNMYSHLLIINDGLELLFCHRWLLLCFKREFKESEVLCIWEACWARHETCHLHLFICVAILALYGDTVLTHGLPADEMLLYFSSLQMHMQANAVLTKARAFVHEFRNLPAIPCQLMDLCSGAHQSHMWDNGRQPSIQCQCHSTPCKYSK